MTVPWMQSVIDLTDEVDPIPHESDLCESSSSEECILIEDSDASLFDLSVPQDDSPILLSDDESQDLPRFHQYTNFKDRSLWPRNKAPDTLCDIPTSNDNSSTASTISDTSSEAESLLEEINMDECPQDLFRCLDDFKREIRHHQHGSPFQEREYATSHQKWQDGDLIFNLLMDSPEGRAMYTFLTMQDRNMSEFVLDPCQPDFYVLDEMPHALRKLIRDRVYYYRLRTEMRGFTKNDRYTAIVRTYDTECPPQRKSASASFAKDVMLHLWWDEWENVKKSKTNKIGGKSDWLEDPLDENNVGHRMLLSMGWTPGKTLGIRNGVLEPISITVRSRRVGLGMEDY